MEWYWIVAYIIIGVIAAYLIFLLLAFIAGLIMPLSEKERRRIDLSHTVTLICPKCEGKIYVFDAERPIQIQCSKCGQTGTLKD